MYSKILNYLQSLAIKLKENYGYDNVLVSTNSTNDGVVMGLSTGYSGVDKNVLIHFKVVGGKVYFDNDLIIKSVKPAKVIKDITTHISSLTIAGGVLIVDDNYKFKGLKIIM